MWKMSQLELPPAVHGDICLRQCGIDFMETQIHISPGTTLGEQTITLTLEWSKRLNLLNG